MNTPNHPPTPLQEAVRLIKMKRLGPALGLSTKAPTKWLAAGRLPLTELSGETHYAQIMEQMTGGQVSAQALIDHSFPNRIRETVPPLPEGTAARCPSLPKLGGWKRGRRGQDAAAQGAGA